MTPTGTPGTNGWSCTDADVTIASPGLSTADESMTASLSMPLGPDPALPGPVTQPSSPLGASETPTTEEESLASMTVAVCAVTAVTWPTSPWPFSTVSFALTPSALPASTVTVC